MATQPQMLKAAVASSVDSNGEDAVDRFNQASSLILAWVQHLHATQMTGSANYMLEGVGSLLRETAAYLALGLGRAALFSIRGQIDLLFSWQYFKDHSVELNVVETTGDGYKLVSDVLKFLNVSHKSFGTRLGILDQISRRRAKQPYHLLSGHIHGQSRFAVPVVGQLMDVVASKSFLDDVISIQADCSEYMSDVFLALNLKDWASVPALVRADLEARKPTPGQRAELFK